MKRVFKYKLEICEKQCITLGKDAELLSVEKQGENLVLYALTDDQAEQKPRLIILHGTGHPADDVEASRFIGTVQMKTSPWELVFHVFDGGTYQF